MKDFKQTKKLHFEVTVNLMWVVCLVINITNIWKSWTAGAWSRVMFGVNCQTVCCPHHQSSERSRIIHLSEPLRSMERSVTTTGLIYQDFCSFFRRRWTHSAPTDPQTTDLLMASSFSFKLQLTILHSIQISDFYLCTGVRCETPDSRLPGMTSHMIPHRSSFITRALTVLEVEVITDTELKLDGENDEVQSSPVQCNKRT